jgi:SAM-dependent methyltransferase
MTAPDPDDVGDYLVSSRSFAEYEAMFALTATDLAGSVLDCPGGGSGFTAEAAARGAHAVAVDPVYALPAAELARLALREPDRGSAHTGAAPDRYRWDFHGDLAGHRAIRTASAEAFAADLAAHPGRYVAGALPGLPFGGGSFDLVLSSHLLFTYADRLDAGFHLRALAGLRRVARREVRVFPLLDQAGRRRDALVEAALAATPGAAVRRVGYEFQRGGDEMLVLPPAR